MGLIGSGGRPANEILYEENHVWNCTFERVRYSPTDSLATSK